MADKSLGQHWLFDPVILRTIAGYVKSPDVDHIIEIGPGLGTLTHELVKLKKTIIAIELDKRLLQDLEDRFMGQPVKFIHQDVLKFDFSAIVGSYSICANIPYYLTSHLMRVLTESNNKPKRAVLLIQKEVAERLTASPGKHSILSATTQLFAKVTLGIEAPAKLFSPPPKVDSQVVILDFYDKPLHDGVEDIIRTIKAGFCSPRKKLRSSLSSGLRIAPSEADILLQKVSVDPARRAQTLTTDEWVKLARVVPHDSHNSTRAK